MREAEYILQLSDIEKSYKGYRVLKGVSLSLQYGKIYGLIGQNGAGKTTLMRIIMGLVFPDNGSIQLYGEYEKKGFVRKYVGCLIESPALYPDLTVSENLSIIQNLRHIEFPESTNEILDMLEMDDLSKKVKNCSLGMRQKVGIALALIGDPQLLVLDEPLNGLDPIVIVRLRKYLQKMVKERNMTVLISSHILGEIDKIASDYILMDRGEIKKITTKKEMEKDGEGKSLEEIYQGWLERGKSNEMLNL
ncbi:MAG: ABC transporter ATP-binding protein [Lachnospiraceae bacterium]|nr:ABC transporter ATP-binding protein [Lachnospiraceae bacterium]